MIVCLTGVTQIINSFTPQIKADRPLEREEASKLTEGFEIWGVITTIIHSV